MIMVTTTPLTCWGSLKQPLAPLALTWRTRLIAEREHGENRLLFNLSPLRIKVKVTKKVKVEIGETSAVQFVLIQVVMMTKKKMMVIMTTVITWSRAQTWCSCRLLHRAHMTCPSQGRAGKIWWISSIAFAFVFVICCFLCLPEIQNCDPSHEPW